MQISQLVEIGAAAAWVVVVGIRCLTIGVTLWPRPLPRSLSADDAPPISVIVPISAVERAGEAEYRSVFAQSYPRFEVLLAAPEGADLTAALTAAARFPRVPVRVVVPDIRLEGNPKIVNLAAAAAVATHDLIAVKDANCVLAEGQLAELASHLKPGIGLVSAVAVGVNPTGFGGDLECAMLNARGAPLLFAGSRLFRLNLALGALMLLRRADLDRIGGFRILANTIGEDQSLANILARQGLRSIFADEVTRQRLDGRSMRDVWNRHLRWAIARRQEATTAFLIEPFYGAAFAALAAALAAPSVGADRLALATGTAAFWLATDVFVVLVKGWGASWRFPFACMVREFFSLAAWVCALSARHVRWGGKTVRLTR